MHSILASPEVSVVIFDIDGTLLDSVELHAQAWKDAFELHGFTFEIQEIRRQIGKGGDQLMPHFLRPDQLEPIKEKLEEDRGKIFKEKYLLHVEPLPASRDLLAKLRSMGKAVALASSAKADECQVYKRIANIEDLVDEDTSSEDADRSKPHPDIFQAALSKMGCGPERAVVVGDTPYDGEAAHKAGLRFVGVKTGGWSQEELVAAHAVEVWADICEILLTINAGAEA